MNTGPLAGGDNGRTLPQAIIDTLPEPILVLDSQHRIVVASRAYYSTFKVISPDVQGRPLYSLGDGQWNIPELRALLEEIPTRHSAVNAFEVEGDFAGIGRRTMLVNGRQMAEQDSTEPLILLDFEDVTTRRDIERRIADLLKQKDILLLEMQHRVANSLQIIASILLLKAQSVRSEESRVHLQDARRRVLSVAAVQQQLLASGHTGTIHLAPYLSHLCQTLGASMIGDSRRIVLKVQVEDRGTTTNEAVGIGLIATELVLNALKHAFLDDKPDARITVHYDVAESNWKLMVSDNGIGRPAGDLQATTPGLGTGIIEALAKQLDAEVHISMAPQGTSVSITHGTMPLTPDFASQEPESAHAAEQIANPPLFSPAHAQAVGLHSTGA
jgi:two-component sensor histidine kinase